MNKKALSLLFFLTFFMLISSNAQVQPISLKCENMVHPIGIDELNPRFSWQIETKEDGFLQKAYMIQIGENEEDLIQEKNLFWNSGIIETETIPVVYSGQDLGPFKKYYWRVRVMNNKGVWSRWSVPDYFEMGMIDQNHWKAQWISDSPDIHLKPAAYFRKAFHTDKNIRSARVYITAGGLYELSINGKLVGDHRMDPAYTRFDRRNLYLSFDVTDYLQSGENAIGVLLGNGWYNHQSTAVWYFDKAPWRARPKFCMELHIVHEDGSREMVLTGQDWKTSLSPLIFNSIYTAEHYDARLDQDGWDRPGFDDSKWKQAMATNAPSENIRAQVMHPIRDVEELSAKELIKINDTTYLYDFGRNIAGVSELSVLGQRGTTIRLKHAERLDERGRADLSNIDVHYRPVDDSDPFQTDICILKGEGIENFRPRFNYKGFRYVELSSDYPLNLNKSSLKAYFMHSDVPVAGHIHSSDATLNKLWEASNTSYLSNLYGYPTDCPQREKNGWTGDAHIALETGLYNFDGISIYEKWLADHRDEQQTNGVLPAIIPSNGWGYTWANGPDWTSTIAIIPWNIYLFYGDIRLLSRCYDNIKRYVDHIEYISPTGLTDWGLGDWVPVKSVAPKEFTSSIYYYVDAVILSKAAKLLGKVEDYQKYKALSEKIKEAIHEKYYDEDHAIYGSGLQTELSAALYWGIVPEEHIAEVAGQLAQKVTADNKHIDVGLLGTKSILNALSENNYAELAWEVASQKSFPSWGYWIEKGATSFLENWDPDASRDISMNHIMFGEINAWYYKALGGIFPDENAPGFKHVILKPHFVEGLDHFEARHEGPYGEIVSSWSREGRFVTYSVEIPPNSTASLSLAGRNIEEISPKPNRVVSLKELDKKSWILNLDSGSYQFKIKE